MKKKNIKKALDKRNKGVDENYKPKLYGESKSVTYEIEGLVKSFCQITEWANGEGYDFSFETKQKETTFSLHIDELELLFAGLEHLGYFNS